MPRSPRKPPRRPIDDDTLRRALTGDVKASAQVACTVSWVVSRVVAQRSGTEANEDRVAQVRGAWTLLVDDGFMVLGRWSSAQPISFEQHVADAVAAWLDAADGLAAGPSGARQPAWTPSLVAAALDGGGELGHELGCYVITHVRACALRTLESFRSRIDVATEAKDMVQDFVASLYDRDGAVLRGWDPGRGRTTLHSYLYFIARREILRRMLREHGRSGGVIPLDVAREHELPISADASALLADAMGKDLVFQVIGGQLDHVDRQLLDLLRQGVPTARGARVLGISENAYYQRKRRLMLKIKSIAATLEAPRGSEAVPAENSGDHT